VPPTRRVESSRSRSNRPRNSLREATKGRDRGTPECARRALAKAQPLFQKKRDERTCFRLSPNALCTVDCVALSRDDRTQQRRRGDLSGMADSPIDGVLDVCQCMYPIRMAEISLFRESVNHYSLGIRHRVRTTMLLLAR
jgi:hypothetical protein